VFFLSFSLALQDFWNTFFVAQFLGGHEFPPGFCLKKSPTNNGEGHESLGHESLGSQEHVETIDRRISEMVTNGDGPGRAGAVRL